MMWILLDGKNMEISEKLSNKGHIIIVVTHNILEVEKYADRYILMNHGKVLEDKNLKTVYKNKRSKLYDC